MVTLLTIALGATSVLGQEIEFDIPDQPLSDALRTFALQAGLQIMFSPGAVPEEHTVALRGRYDPSSALAQMLEGTGLGFVQQGRSIAIRSQVQANRSDQLTQVEEERDDSAEPTTSTRASPRGQQDQSPTSIPGDRRELDARTRRLEELVVTARRREENLRDVPVAISVLDRARLDQIHIDTPEEAMAYAPGFDYGSSNANRLHGTVSVRGIRSSRVDSNSAYVANLVDGRPLTGQAGWADFMDVARVELYRGPQAAAFGPNTFAGAVNYVTLDPSEELEGITSLEFGEDGRKEIIARLRGPLSGTLGYVVSARAAKYDGPDEWLSSNFGDFYGVPETGIRLGAEKTDSLTAKLKWTPSDRLEAEIRYARMEVDDIPGAEWDIHPVFWDLSSGTQVAIPDSNNWGFVAPVADPSDPGIGSVVFGEIDAGHPVLLRNYDDEFAPYVPVIRGEREYFSAELNWYLCNGPTLTFSGSGGNDRNTPVYDGGRDEIRESFASGAHALDGFPDHMDEYYAETRAVSPSDGSFRWLIGYSKYGFEYRRSRARLNLDPTGRGP